jgi:acyl-CoA reductase-like NAD-dependent aldehyde dehydrogenase
MTMKQFKTLLAGKWLTLAESIEVKDKFTGEILGLVPKASKKDVEIAINTADSAFNEFRKYPAYKRAEILSKTADLLVEEKEKFAEMLAKEVGKAWKFALGEVERAIETFNFAAEEAKRIHGETVPLDASPSGVNRQGYYYRVPVGVVAAIAPFNFPLNLVAHKVAPAIAAGNTVVLKPASATPIVSIMLAEVLLKAGLPAEVFNIVIGSGSTVGNYLVENPKCRKISFTGSQSVGEEIMKKAGIKKVTMELGNNSATIVDESANIEKAVPRCVVSAFACSGQVCISLQRLYVHRNIVGKFIDEFVKKVKELKVGNPLDKDTDVGPMIDEKEAIRAEEWINEAVSQGAKLLLGGKREKAVLYPTVLTDVQDNMKVVCQEIFAPVVSIEVFDDFKKVVDKANNTPYGLQAGVFTSDIYNAYYAINNIDVGGVMINDTSMYRVDHMPYGGNKLSGIGREGLKYAIEEMTNIKMVVFNLN